MNAKRIELHPVSPQPRLVDVVVDALRAKAVIAYPTSSGYALGCSLTNQDGVERIRRIRRLDAKQDFTLMCASISDASNYAKIDNSVFTMLKRLDTEKYTFLLKATNELSKKIHSKRGTIGIRLASSPAITAVLETLGEPILSTSLLVPTGDSPSSARVHEGFTRGLEVESFSTAYDVEEALGGVIDVVVDLGESTDTEPTTVLDLVGDEPVLIRQGQGEFLE
ncbi:MAG: threonylcarbamoyl-AMP synthase [Candidatus Ancillula sp.]|jgi:tRNA threonylcarbamoyl adenosine modification protein (Sua5/YciO/YrdC/YwlC family)|nr:threonylcarbamoyl-AMP synthase [Candidatus Ancillula sp.]